MLWGSIMETLLLKILAVQNEILATHQEILAEVRLLRQSLEQNAPAPAVTAAPAPVEEAPAPMAAALPRQDEERPQPAPTPTAQPVAPEPISPPPPEPRRRARGMLTLDELTDLGGEFLDAAPRSKTSTKPMGADRDAPLLDGIKAKNRAKRDAFAEFDRLRHDR